MDWWMDEWMGGLKQGPGRSIEGLYWIVGNSMDFHLQNGLEGRVNDRLLAGRRIRAFWIAFVRRSIRLNHQTKERAKQQRGRKQAREQQIILPCSQLLRLASSFPYTWFVYTS